MGKSTFVWIIACLVMVDVVMCVANPLWFLNNYVPTGISHNPVVCKLPQFLNSDRTPDVMITGSSLMLLPAVRCDDAFHGRRTRYDSYYGGAHILEYNRADYFDSLLLPLHTNKIDLVNLGIVGSMMSDHFLIFKRSISYGKKPRLLICGVAPRDFMDNSRAEVEQTPTYYALADVTSIGDLIRNHASFERMFDFFLGQAWQFWRSREDWHAVLTTTSALALNRPVNLFLAAEANRAKAANKMPATAGATTGVDALENSPAKACGPDWGKPIYEAPPNNLPDLSMYKEYIYYPLNSKLYREQMYFLKNMLMLAQKQNVAVLLLDTPITKQNLDLLPPSLLERYRQDLKRLAASYGAKYVNPLDTGKYDLPCFEDSCHMTALGGRKLYGCLTKTIAEDPKLLAALRGK